MNMRRGTSLMVVTLPTKQHLSSHILTLVDSELDLVAETPRILMVNSNSKSSMLLSFKKKAMATLEDSSNSLNKDRESKAKETREAIVSRINNIATPRQVTFLTPDKEMAEDASNAVISRTFSNNNNNSSNSCYLANSKWIQCRYHLHSPRLK